MLSSNELNAFLRDERAWRRAAQRPMEDDMSGAGSINSKEANWPIFRRGTSDNAFSLKFANSLRATCLPDSLRTTGSHPGRHYARKKWNASVRGAAEATAVADPLQQLLARNLERRRPAKAHAAPSHRTASAVHEREWQRAAERVRRELVDLEREARRDIVTAARHRWRAITAAFFSEATNQLLLAELCDRRIIFRAWQEEKQILSSAMYFEQSCLTEMTARQFKQHCQLIQSEALVRNRIANDEKECRDLMDRYAYVEYLKALEAEIEACKRHELRLRRRLA